MRINVDASEIDDPLAFPGRAHGVERVAGVFLGLMDNPLEADGLLDDLVVQEELRAAWIHSVLQPPLGALTVRSSPPDRRGNLLSQRLDDVAEYLDPAAINAEEGLRLGVIRHQP